MRSVILVPFAALFLVLPAALHAQPLGKVEESYLLSRIVLHADIKCHLVPSTVRVAVEQFRANVRGDGNSYDPDKDPYDIEARNIVKVNDCASLAGGEKVKGALAGLRRLALSMLASVRDAPGTCQRLARMVDTPFKERVLIDAFAGALGGETPEPYRGAPQTACPVAENLFDLAWANRRGADYEGVYGRNNFKAFRGGKDTGHPFWRTRNDTSFRLTWEGLSEEEKSLDVRTGLLDDGRVAVELSGLPMARMRNLKSMKIMSSAAMMATVRDPTQSYNQTLDMVYDRRLSVAASRPVFVTDRPFKAVWAEFAPGGEGYGWFVMGEFEMRFARHGWRGTKVGGTFGNAAHDAMKRRYVDRVLD
ncbi:hypothetical protein [Erythrobacter sp.]|uniref:hypothetical protein n=1 Tax=Erythrobacter sp. TaxID=1042 RepID=UPI001425CF4E|nr:hypothetical protein [Erythrobacter sp.]QIQ86870.1 MAG: hypothetical protein G9473_09370 [Erythrobacter sp.]